MTAERRAQWALERAVDCLGWALSAQCAALLWAFLVAVARGAS
jgi:hypothetical protein